MTAHVVHAKDYALDAPSLPRIAWAPERADLHVNLVVLHGGEVIGEHINQTLDVLLTCLAGNGDLHVDGEIVPLTPGTVALMPLGAGRGVASGNGGLRYTTCHLKRGGIMPTVHRRD